MIKSSRIFWSVCFLLFSLKVEAQFNFELRMNPELETSADYVVEIVTPNEEKVFDLRYKLDALDDDDFKDQIKPSKFFKCSRSTYCFRLKRQYLHRGQYVLEVEIDYKKKRIFDWVNYLESSQSKKLFLKFEVESAVGDE